MNWQNVRKQFPSTWVVIEALQVHNQNDEKIIDDISVLEQYESVMDALKYYKRVSISSG